ncbi:hypothetical protein KAS50_04335, partial [bacterium]|nr:hypothetical protein [bacterium]
MANVLNTFYLSKTGYITNINPLPKIIKQKMGITIIFVTFLLCFCLFTSNAQGFEDVYAIINGTVNTGTGETINKGTIIIRNGLIENVGKNIPLPPDAIIIDSKSLQIYPGIINTFSTLGIPKTSDKQKSAQNKGQDNNKLVNSDVSSFDYINMKAAEIKAARESGITTALVAQPEGIFQGTSVLLNLLDEAPEKAVVKTNIAQHLSFSKNPKGYPGSSMGIIAFIRQTFYDVDHYRETMEIYNDQQQGFKRPEYNKSLESLFPVINEKLPIIIDAHKEMEIRCAIKIANEFNLNYILCGVTEGFLTGELLKRENKPVIVSLK